MIATPNPLYVVGPGPIAMRDWTGRHREHAVRPGCYAVARNDVHGPRLADATSYPTRADAQRAADWATLPD